MARQRTCARCGAPKSETEAHPNLCPRCLLEAGFESQGSEPVRTGGGATRVPAPSLSELAESFPELEIQELVGQGGTGYVYRARQKNLDRLVALKILAIDLGEDPSFAERFQREARALASLSHPGLVTVFDFGKRGPWFHLLMEFVDGATLRQMLRARTVAPREALSIVGHLCDALQYAHDRGVVHRDIKPENVIVTKDGDLKILDFGLAKLLGAEPGERGLTLTGQAMGTPHYMAPEQWERPLEVDHRADLYSLGVVFYELLTGELPVGRFPLPSTKVEVDVRLDEVVLKSLEKEPARRYQMASEIRTDVQSVAAAPAPRRVPRRPAKVTAPVDRAPVNRAPGRRREGGVWPVVIALVFLLCLGLGILFVVGSVVFMGRSRVTAEMEAATRQRELALRSEAQATELELRIQEGIEEASRTSPTVPWENEEMRGAVLSMLLDRTEEMYIELEREHVELAWDDEGRLHVTIASFPEERASLLDALEGSLRRYAGDEEYAERLFASVLSDAPLFGERAEQLQLEQVDGVLQVWRKSPEDGFERVEPRAGEDTPTWAARHWEAGQALRE